MPYTPQTWANADSVTGGGTETSPLTAARLQYIESGIDDNAVISDAAAISAASAVSAIPAFAAAAVSAASAVSAVSGIVATNAKLDATAISAASAVSAVSGIVATNSKLDATAISAASAASAVLNQIPKTLVDAKGDLLVGSANDTVVRLAKGTTGQVLAVSADSSLYWADAASGGGGGGAPSGPAGGVLGGTYPDPSFAVDMATQAELDVVAVSAASAVSAVSGIVATNTKLDATAISAASAVSAVSGIVATNTKLDATAISAASSVSAIADLVPKSLVDAKGDLIVGTADNTVARLAKGTTGQVLAVSADSSLYWADAASGGGAGAKHFPIQLLNPRSTTLAGNSFFTVLGLSDWDAGHWEFVKDVDGKIYGVVRVPNAYSSGGTIRLAIGANATSGVTRLGVGTKAVADGESLNPTLTDETKQDITVPGTAYLRKDVTFSLTETLAADDLLLVEIFHEGSHSNDTLAVNTLLMGAWLEVTA